MHTIYITDNYYSVTYQLAKENAPKAHAGNKMHRVGLISL
jgi:hypothetical protein